nr:MAG TPA: Cytosine specific methyltransferase [Caudoviricetes sp.]
MRILNLYAGIGGNRKLWGDKHEITAVEIDPDIAAIYKDLYPNDNIIIGDAHEYLRTNFRNYDFIWASPPCPTHSVLQMTRYYNENLKYPDMTLYQEIIWLQTFFKGKKWVIENVKPYYTPLISPTFSMDRHYFWSSDFILTTQFRNDYTSIRDNNYKMAELYGFDINTLKTGKVELRKILRNCVVPEIGKYILEQLTREVDNVNI